MFEALSDSNCFKDFGFGRVVNGYDLPSMVVGHNMSINKKYVKTVGGFSDSFIGWGLEDSFFGAKVIAEGCFVIPLLDTGVYHVNHPPRSGSTEAREIEYQKNIETYRNLTEKTV